MSVLQRCNRNTVAAQKFMTQSNYMTFFKRFMARRRGSAAFA